jgi:alpha-N-arabinofuranosidase
MAKIEVMVNHIMSEVDPKIFGHFTEHAFRNIYEGMYDPESPLSDEDGYRTDVMEAMRKANVTLLRYPGGNFASNYHWEDGVGPKETRKRVFDYAWKTEESNQFGTAEFIKLCRKVGAEPLICLNMGTGTIQEAMGWVEYCNGTGNTYYANLRRSHGYEEPFRVKYWGLGNELYGMWQMNHKSAEDYAKEALEYAKAVKWIDPSVSLIACGYEQDADWNYTVMKTAGQLVDYISAHHYSVGWGLFQYNYLDNLYVPEYMQRLTDLTLAAAHTGMNDICDVKVAWDEWNLFGWEVDRVNDDRFYTLHDAIITALIINMFIRNSGKIGMANYSTFVNINGAVSTKPDGMVRRSQYPVFELLANSTGRFLLESEITECGKLEVNRDRIPALGRQIPGIDLTPRNIPERGNLMVNEIDCAVTRDETGNLFLSLINKHPEKDVDVQIILTGGEDYEIEDARTIWNEDLNAANTEDRPDCIGISGLEGITRTKKGIELTLRRHSVNLIRLAGHPSVT